MPIVLTESKRGQVLDSLCTALRAMTVVGGYHWNVQATSVQTDPINLLGVPSEKRPFFCVEPSPLGNREFEPADAMEEFFRVLLTGIVDAEGTAFTDRKTAAGECLAMDMERAVTVDLHRGGVAIDTRVLEPEIVASLGAGHSVLVVQELECRIYRDHGVP